MTRIVRYQGAIVRDHHMLLIRFTRVADGHSRWIIPGGGIEPGESEEQCVAREMWEETNLRVRVERLLFDDEMEPGKMYRRHKTFLCAIESGEASPGHEPEEGSAPSFVITAVGWFDLRDPAAWPVTVRDDGWIHPLLQRIGAALGYVPRVEATVGDG